MSEDIRTELILKLKEIFRSDRSDLDFGIYRILNFKRKEIKRFIEEELVKQAESEFSELVKANFEEQKAELDALKEEINRDFGEGTIDERGEVRRLHDAPKIKRYIELKQSIADQERVQTQINEVFNHVYEFFSRYYNKGDFISQRLFGGREKYVIPHNGEEVSLYWVNQDQYYIKTSEDYRKYSFNLGDYNITFKLVEAESEKNNNVGSDRFFVIHRELPVRFDEENNSLYVFFEHRPLTDEDFDFYEIGRSSNQNTRFDTIIDKDYDIILDSLRAFSDLSKKIKSTEHNDEKKSELKHHLIQYYRKNDMDYFIHKRLGEFLRRELDFYIKNEVLDLDETIFNDAKNIKLMQLKIGAIKKISDQIITFLDQIERFQKDLFEKKKMVIKTEYCITLDNIDEKLYLDILANQKQLQQWKELYLFDIDEELQKLNSQLDAFNPSKKYTLEDKKILVLRQNPTLTIDTQFFDPWFKYKVIEVFEDLDNKITGILIKSENLQALNLLLNKYQNSIDCCYIDPPFNTAASEILYKNNYKNSSWLAMLSSRIKAGKKLLGDKAIQCSAIDDFEFPVFALLLSQIFGSQNKLAVVPIRSNPHGRAMAAGFSTNHEYAIFYGVSNEAEIGRLPRDEQDLARYPQKDDKGFFTWINFRGTGANTMRSDRPKLYYPVFVKKEKIRIPSFFWSNEKGQWETSETINADEVAVYPIDSTGNERVWTLGWERARVEAEDSLIAKKVNGRWEIYRKYHPNQEGALPSTWWDDAKYSATESGTRILKDLFGDRNLFSYPKSVFLVEDCLRSSNCTEKSLVIDYFAGSGTTGHAVFNLNKSDGGHRKFILVEFGDYFDTALKPRILKVIFTDDWKDGKPKTVSGSPKQIIKYQQLEQYEDTLNNILFSEKGGFAQTMLHKLPDYFLQHVLDVETKDSPTRLTVDRFKTPFDYKIKILQEREEKTEPVDLVETFNYLLGIKVKKIRQYENEQAKYIVVYGEKGEEASSSNVLIIWRNYDENILEKEKQFIEQKILPQFNPNIIYVNVDSLIKGAESIEPKFKELMGA
ncbi:MAG: hypothetical protein D4S01_00545 [Dehalococcoidia bacterium]|nr:MAG: hypothetical protein D4S01_00545 [Dehalococcoidia bacterium]